MKVVAVSQRVNQWPKRNETCDSLDHRLIVFLVKGGYIPLPVPNSLGSAVHLWLCKSSPAAIVLSGGNDIGDYPQRDSTELLMLDYAKSQGLPVLGICRGMQMMAHWSGMSLRGVTGHVRTRHRLSGDINGSVNSYHNYALSGCPAGFFVLARSLDSEIEAIRHNSFPWEGWMWHPEREMPFTTRDLHRMKGLFR